MAKIIRKTLTQFGVSGPSTAFGQFGSKEAGSPQTSQDPTVLQQLTAWAQGWQNAVVSGNKAAYLEDMNGWCFVHSYMMAYVLQQGIPEWDSGTTYFQNSVVQANSGQWFNSLQDNNLGNAPPVGASNAFWDWVNAPVVIPPNAVATGTIIDHAGGPTPSGYLPCDGSEVAIATYNALYTQITTGGTLFPWGVSASPGVTFKLPDLRRRTAVGSGGTGSATLGNAVGNVGGEEAHVLTIPEMPSHTHNDVGYSPSGGPGNGYTAGASQNGTVTSATGGGGAHNNIQPSAVVVKLIKT